MWLINPFETAIKYCMMKKHDGNSYSKKLFYLPYIWLETVFSSAQITSTFEKSDLYCRRFFWGFIQLPMHLVVIFLSMLLGSGSGLSLLALMHMLYILQKNDGRCRWVECNPRVLLIVTSAVAFFSMLDECWKLLEIEQ